jgi:hypothetical protein
LEDEKKSLGFLKQGFIKKKKQKNIGGQKKKSFKKGKKTRKFG